MNLETLRSRPTSDAARRTILLVEDEALIAMAESMTLEREGYRVISASNGEDAVALVNSEQQIDLILMDINLGPGIDGTQAAEMILRDHNLPIVFLSSHTEPEVVERTERITSYGYIVKTSGKTVLTTSLKMAFRLFESRKLVADTFDYSINGLCVHQVLYDESGKPFDCKYLNVNQAFESHTGLSPESVIGKTIRDIYPNDEAQGVLDLYFSVLFDGQPVRREIYFEPMENWFELSIFPTRDDEFTVVIANMTERKLAQEQIATEKERLRVTLQSVGDAVIATDTSGNVVLMNAVAETLTGWDQASAIGKPLVEVFTIVSAITRQTSENPVDRALRDGKTVGLANHTVLISTHGDERQISDSAAPIRDSNGTIIGVVLVFRDVTEAYELQRALHENERDLKRAQEIAKVGSWRCDVGTRTVTLSGQAQSILGLEEHVVPLDSIRSIVSTEQRDSVDLAICGLETNAEPYLAEFEIRRPSGGGSRHVHLVAGRDAGGQSVVGTIQDITDRKAEEAELAERETYYRTLADSGQALIWTSGLDMRCNYFNQIWLAFTGRTLEQELGDGWTEGVHADDLSACMDTYSHAFERREPFTMYYRLRRADGEYRWIQDDGTPRFDSTGSFVGYIGHCLDVTELKDAESTLAEERLRLATIMETSPAGIVTVDADGNITYANRLAEEVLGLTRTEATARRYDAPLWRTTTLDGEPFPDEMQPFSIVKATRSPVSDVRHAIVRPDGRRIDLSVNGGPILDSAGQFAGMVATIEDITVRRRSEEQIHGLLTEKEYLLKEAHHRFKNNTNAVRSVLSTHAYATSNSETRSALEDAAGRLDGMVLLYDKLYRHEGSENIALKTFLPSLLEEIVDLLDPRASVVTASEIDDIVLDSNVLSVLGIVLYELVTNSLKHAFSEIEQGLITVSAKRSESRIDVIYEDNGPGTPEEINSESSRGFGMQLVDMLVRHIDGEIRIERNGGTRIVIAVPAALER